MSETYFIWPWRPQQQVVESLEWLTDVIEAYDGSEQRIRLRLTPRQSWEAEVQLDDSAQLAAINLALTGWQDRLWGWGVWHEQRRLTNTLPAGSTAIAVDTRYADFRADSLALLWSSPEAYEAVEVAGVTENSLTLADGTMTSQVYAPGSLIMPLRLARMANKAKRDDSVTNVSKWVITMTSTENVDLAGAAAPTQYLGYDVLPEPLLMPAATMPREVERAVEILDPGPGDWAVAARMDWPHISSDYRWRTSSAASTWALRQWLHRRAGRLLPVWIPSWRDDLVLAEAVNAADPVIIVKDAGYRYFGVDQPTKQHVAVIRADGSLVCRKILAAEDGGIGQELLTLDGAIGFADVSRISFLSLHRFAADKVEIAWKRPGIVEVNGSMMEMAA